MRRGAGVTLLIFAITAGSVAGILWFMSHAVSNERVAVERRLAEAYEAQLQDLAQKMDASWNEASRELEIHARGADPRATFHDLVTSEVVEGAIIRDENGIVLYPDTSSNVATDTASDKWLVAEEMEFAQKYPAGAAEEYESIANGTEDVNLKARATIAQARCLAKSGQTTQAVALLNTAFDDAAMKNAADAGGNVLVLNAQLLAHELTGNDPDATESLNLLVDSVLDYSRAAPSAQRRYLLAQISEMTSSPAVTRMLTAERLSWAFLESAGPRQSGSVLAPTPLPGVWQLESPGRRVVALLTTARVQHLAERVLSAAKLPAGARVRFHAAYDKANTSAREIRVASGAWALSMTFPDGDPFSTSAARNVQLLVITGTTAAILILVGGVMLLRFVGRQMRLAALKSDLAATVSHELRTPLAGMRAVIETLEDDEALDDQQRQEYIAMLGGENRRLTRVIENFLAFSRMERGRQNYRMEDLDAGELVREAADEMRDRFRQNGFLLLVESSNGNTAVRGDRSALLTAVGNLLDNALKYSEGDRIVTARVLRNNGWVSMQVEDNGPGIPLKEQERIFQKFYQAYRPLTKTKGGCGLGLSIVKSIAESHGGTAVLRSQPGSGSLFEIRLPALSGTE